MRFFIIFIVALFTINAAHAESYAVLCPENYYIVDEHCEPCPGLLVNPAGSTTECTGQCPNGEYYKFGQCKACPDGYPNSDPLTNQCYSDTKMRPYDGTVTCRMPDRCIYAKCTVCESEPAPCEYVEYSDGTIKSGCATNTCYTSIIDVANNKDDGSIYNPESGACEVCGPGMYFVAKVGLKETTVSCFQCPAGTYQPNSSTSGSCQTCPAGTYSDAGAAECTPCAPGTYSDTTGAAECTPCADGMTSVAGATQCVVPTCDNGFYGDGTTCTKCPDEYPHSDIGATAKSECYSDVKIREWTGEQTAPDTLPAGCAGATYGECKIDACEYVAYLRKIGTVADGVIKSGCKTNNANCVKPILSVTANPGYIVNGTACTQCPAGTYSAGGDAMTCTQCPAGTYSSAAGASECTPCPYGYPNSEPGATAKTQCYSNEKERPWTGHQVCNVPTGCADAICPLCEIKPCKYVAYVRSIGVLEGKIKFGCTTNDANCSTPVQSISSAPGWRTVGTSRCEICPAGTYSPGGNATTCNACPNGATTFAGATSRDECMRILNYLPTGQTTPTKIYLSMKQNTHPAFAAKIGDDIFYANMTPVDAHDTPGLYVGYNGDNYRVQSGIKSDFFVTTTSDTSSFSFTMTAAGNFFVDWGDGAMENIVRGDTTNTTYSHTYYMPGEYTIGFGGSATEYNSVCFTKVGLRKIYIPAIGFNNNANIAGISGTLADMFPTIGGTNPSFIHTFYGTTNLTGEIPPGLFADFTGTPHSCMFQNTFQNTPNLTGPTARTANGTRIYDIEYNGEKWIDAYPSAFTDMYTGSGIDTNN